MRQQLLDVVFPPVCAGCHERGAAICDQCLGSLVPAGVLAPPRGVEALVALMELDELSGRFVKAIKYANHRDALPPLAQALARRVTRWNWWPDLVTWVPTSARRKRERGYDQAELLARRVGRHLRVPTRRVLLRSDAGSQTRRTRRQRLEGATFEPLLKVPARILLVDDVVTTGSSIAHAAAALRIAGAQQVRAGVLARTPG
jgi:ComF family protein